MSAKYLRNVPETWTKLLQNVFEMSANYPAKRARNLREIWSKRLRNGIETSVKGARKVRQTWPKH